MTTLLDPRTRLAAIVAAALLARTGAVATTADKTAPAAAAAGLQDGPAPWSPIYASLARRLAALRLPASDTAFYIHARLRVFINGKPVRVPAQIGIDPQGRFLAPLDTHDATGIVHIESQRPYPLTLGQFSTIWGVRFTDTRIGGYANQRAKGVRVFVHGPPVAHPAARVLRASERIVVGYGTPPLPPDHRPHPLPTGL